MHSRLGTNFIMSKSITLKTLPIAAIATAIFALTAATSFAADNKSTLDNGLLLVTLGKHGMVWNHDNKLDRTIDLASGRFSLTVDGNVIKSSSITLTVKKENVGSGAF
jgi:hypothetical protein